ncbi:MAG: ABC-F family ATP-binding cassette domain-containing protein [Clostridia bacterium]|nr:ABC-F family ATP-binding cassette domain-containing protein [Clostridia bacterium]
MQITVINGSVEYDGVPILTDVDFELHDKEKVALVGRNGCGKTTLLKALVGEVPFVKGTGEEDFGMYVNGKPTIGYLKQVAFNNENGSMYEEVRSAYSSLLELERKMNDALSRLQQDQTEEAAAAYSRLHDAFESSGGYTYEKECYIAIKKFGFSDEEMKKPINEFSGGQRTKIALLKLLLSRPDVLFLDEPTNHLDVEAVAWLESYLKNYRGSLVVVSHDRMFLDRVVNVVYEIEYGEATRYRGNYSDFWRQKKANYEKAMKDASLRFKEIARLQKVVDRFRYKATKAAMAQSKLKQIEKLGTMGDAPNPFDDKTFHAGFQPLTESVRKTLIVDKLCFGYDKPLGNLSFTLERGQKLGVIGANGCGKSTFIRTIMNKIPALSGNFQFGLHAEIGYFDQTATQSSSEQTVFDHFHDAFPLLTDTEVRTALGAFLLSGEDVFKRVCVLSGGEKVRLALCMILKTRPNVLILDEPTNHMDIVGKETFETMLRAYTGTVIVVSHDRYLINKVCDRILGFKDGGAVYFEGGYEEYEIKCAAVEEEKPAASAPVKNKNTDYKNNPQKEADRRARRAATLEKKITENEALIAEKQSLLSSPDVFSNYKKIMDIQTEIDKLTAENETLMTEWAALSE